MSTRIQVVLDEKEREQFRREAASEGISLSAWMREAARERAASAGTRPRHLDAEGLRAFFAECDARETGSEPDWEQHLRVIEHSARSGGTGT
jgi:hypothetical protein